MPNGRCHCRAQRAPLGTCATTGLRRGNQLPSMRRTRRPDPTHPHTPLKVGTPPHPTRHPTRPRQRPQQPAPSPLRMQQLLRPRRIRNQTRPTRHPTPGPNTRGHHIPGQPQLVRGTTKEGPNLKGAQRDTAHPPPWRVPYQHPPFQLSNTKNRRSPGLRPPHPTGQAHPTTLSTQVPTPTTT